MIGGFQLPNCT